MKTQDKYFTMFRQLMIWSAAERYLDKVPGGGVKVAGLKKLVPGEQRDPYSPNQLIKIIKSPLYAGHKSEDCRHKPGTLVIRDDYFWVPLIALYSGMRLGEILQLLKSDVKEENGIWYFDVNKGGEGKIPQNGIKQAQGTNSSYASRPRSCRSCQIGPAVRSYLPRDQD